MPSETKKGPVQILIFKVDNIRNDLSQLKGRVSSLESSYKELQGANAKVLDYVKTNFGELFSQLESASETMDEFTEFMESFGGDEDLGEHVNAGELFEFTDNATPVDIPMIDTSDEEFELDDDSETVEEGDS